MNGCGCTVSIMNRYDSGCAGGSNRKESDSIAAFTELPAWPLRSRNFAPSSDAVYWIISQAASGFGAPTGIVYEKPPVQVAYCTDFGLLVHEDLGLVLVEDIAAVLPDAVDDIPDAHRAVRPAPDLLVAFAAHHLFGRLDEGVPRPGVFLEVFIRCGHPELFKHVDVIADPHRVHFRRDRVRLALRLEEVGNHIIEVAVARLVDVPGGMRFHIVSQVGEEAPVLEAGEVEIHDHADVRQIARREAGQQPVVVLTEGRRNNRNVGIGRLLILVHQQAVRGVPGAPYGKLDLGRLLHRVIA